MSRHWDEGHESWTPRIPEQPAVTKLVRDTLLAGACGGLILLGLAIAFGLFSG